LQCGPASIQRRAVLALSSEPWSTVAFDRLPRPSILLASVLASTSIVTLLIYFSGWMSMPEAVFGLLLPSLPLLALLAVWAWATGRADLLERMGAGLWAGSFATLAYDLVRVPIAHAGVPVFKAISYFGTVILAVSRPTPASEIVGWTYHFSNGVGFALMYTLLVSRPRWLSAVLWGVGLEVAMLMTPYAEVFGYRRSPGFIAASLAAHVCYGVGLWLAARYYYRRRGEARGADGRGRTGGMARLAAAWMAGPLVIALIAADFHHQHARSIPASPPPDIGPNLFVTWNVPEPDRIGAIWLVRRFLRPDARFHFVEPMSIVSFGTPFDLPEAQIRRSQNRSAFDLALDRAGRQDDPALRPLARMCYMTEIRPWALASDDEARRLAEGLAARLDGCTDLERCLDEGLAWFDETYAELREAYTR